MAYSKTVRRSKGMSGTALVLSIIMLLSVVLTLPPGRAHAADSYLLSKDRPAYASGTEGNNTPDLAVDGNAGSRWSSSWGTDPNWIYVDLGATATVDRVVLRWEGLTPRLTKSRYPLTN